MCQSNDQSDVEVHKTQRFESLTRAFETSQLDIFESVKRAQVEKKKKFLSRNFWNQKQNQNRRFRHREDQKTHSRTEFMWVDIKYRIRVELRI